MRIKTKHFHLNSELTLSESSESPLTICAVTLALTKEVHKITECRLTFQVSLELYQRIDSEALFNLKPEIRTPLSGGSFQLSPDIQIEAILDSDLLPQLAKNVKTSNQAAAYLQKLSKEQPNHPLLSPYSWYGLQVKQQQEKGETGYSTVWAYLKPSDITQDGIDGKKLNDAMFDFAKEWANNNQSATSEDVISQTVENMTQIFTELMNNISESTEKVISETLEEIATVFEELTEDIYEITEEITNEGNVFEAIVNFFQAEDWQFQQISGEETLRLTFQGKNGKWNCYAKARVQKQQMVFYSICPILAPEMKRSEVSEFMTRANYGLIIGNFELDFADGEIRFKTSIDVEGDNLTSALIKHLVYANITMMDEYLPGIMAVIENKVSPAEAIAQIESPN
ncbi:YbjN domain-containing protein [Nostoc flagelliforme FACHB-838]|uniref:YbjN domain-containing protein n=1 Tax=Nostoc flagelliforme FACHB-838 TaxID=2692904 RepID=A0ABR8E2M4_9NOSO|nr:YbjN domain-containing protein [Nostoc flagelliforme]MBD2535906.1 YbjN domain-containing protein [Nostoc flagelliforme FACHB-838]